MLPPWGRLWWTVWRPIVWQDRKLEREGPCRGKRLTEAGAAAGEAFPEHMESRARVIEHTAGASGPGRR